MTEDSEATSPAPDIAPAEKYTADIADSAAEEVASVQPVAANPRDVAGRPLVGSPGRIQDVVPRLVRPRRREYRPSVMGDEASVGALRVVAGSVRGPAHHDFGIPGQDSFALRQTSEGTFLCIAVADGVSEAPLSHQAADLAAQMSVSLVAEHLDVAGPDTIDWAAITRQVSDAILSRARPAVAGLEEAEQAQVELTVAKRVMSTTLMVAVCGTDPQGGQSTYSVAQISGDGSLCSLGPDGLSVLLVGKETRDGMRDNSVNPLPRAQHHIPVTTGTIPSGEALLLCTDGLGDWLDDAGVRDVLTQGLAEPVTVEELLRLLSFVRDGALDDRTAVVVWR